MTRILSLGLDTYGIFDGRNLPLGAGLTVVAGANETGKSTALRALADLLWGLPTRHWLSEVTPRAAIRLSAELETSSTPGEPENDSVATVTRTSRGLHAGGDLLRAVHNPWGTDGDASRTRWLVAFGLNHASLRDGGRQVCDGGGDLAELVFTAHHGRPVQDLLQEIERRADALYKEHRGNKGVRLRVALEDYQRSRRELDEALVRASQVTDAELQVSDLERRTADASANEAKVRQEITRLAEHLRCLDPVHALHRARGALAALREEGPLLDPEALSQYDQARSALRDAEQEHDRVTEQVRVWTREREALTVDRAILADADLIDDLRAQAEARTGDRDRAETRGREAEDHDTEARRHLEELLGHADPRDTGVVLDAASVPAELAAQLDALAERHSTLLADRTHHVDGVERTRAELDALAQGRDLPAVEDIEPLTSAIGALTSDDSVLTRLRVAKDTQVEARRRRRQSMVEAGADDPEADPPRPPAEEDLTDALARLGRARENADQAEQRRREAEEVLEEHRRRRQELEDPLVVHPDELARVRAERDGLWTDITRAWMDGVVPVGTDPTVMAARFGDRLHHADTIADQLIGQAHRDAELAQAQRNIDESERKVGELAHADRDAAENLAGELASWQGRWAALGLAAPSAARADAARRALLAAATAARDEAAARETAQDLEPEIIEWTGRLRELLATLAPSVTTAPAAAESAGNALADLDHLIAAGRSLIADVDRAREQQEGRRLAGQALARSRAQLTRSEQALTDWSAEWATLLAAAGLPATLDPRGWTERRTHLQAARTSHRAATALRGEADAGLRAWESFRTAVTDLGTRHGSEGAPEHVIDDLTRRLTTSRADERTDAERTASIEEGTRRTAQLSGIRAEANSVLDDLRRRTDLPGHEELAEAADRGRRLAEHRDTEVGLLEALRVALDPGHEPEEALVALAATDKADTEVRAGQAERDLERARDDHSELAQELGAAKKNLADLQQRADAFDLNARVQEQIATVADLAEEFATLHLQRRILREALETEASRNASPLLQTAGRFLERLTAGRWVALRAEDDGAGTRGLNVVRHDGTSHSPATLSEGTADQVFLALRLAGILHLQNERRREGQALVPVVLDDVLMAFDDARAANALRTLAEIAAGMQGGDLPMQVVLFTHHDHLARMAEGLGREDLRIVPLDVEALPDDRVDPEVLRESVARTGEALTAAGRASSAARQSRTPLSRGAPAGATTAGAQADPVAVRAWARQNGIEVAERGRLPGDVVRRYLDTRHG